ncbi:uncharacterized protein LOC123504431 [Portunus trituberculatus]|uniref:uncharacterized protein LOC123504431 n=1 Tax=Portunus trituberculatus TaxID=210409 RepID=UPI001E1CE541|nr:uncharacterized protein LOC123504431 [Portunus trituberculatus]
MVTLTVVLPCQEKCERHSKTSQHSLSGSSGSPVSNCRESHEGGRGVRYRRDSAVDSGPDDNTLSKSLQYLGHPLRPHQPETDPIQTGRSFAPPLLSAAPPQAQSQLDPSTFAAVLFHQPGGTVLPAPPERHVAGSVNETLALRLHTNGHREANHSDGCDPDGRELQDLPVHLEGTTKSYMERMDELVATRLAISDTEEGALACGGRARRRGCSTTAAARGSRRHWNPWWPRRDCTILDGSSGRLAPNPSCTRQAVPLIAEHHSYTNQC